MASESIRILGARQHNLKNLSLEIPRERLVVVTGPSGSGKSSLAFDTLYAEGQRRYVESLSAYARQFLDKLQKPEVDFIEGLSPAIAIEQRSSSGNPRSTIATTTEIYDYLRILYAAVGQPHDPVTGEAVHRLSGEKIVDALLALDLESRVMLLAPVVSEEKGEFRDVLERLKRDGFVRARIDGEIMEIGGPQSITRLPSKGVHSIEVVVDRLVVKEGIRGRMAESVDMALKLGRERLVALVQAPSEGSVWEERAFSTAYENPVTGFRMPALTPKHFSFNSYVGACAECEGLGTQLQMDPDLVVEDPQKSLADGAIVPWKKAGKPLEAFYEKVGQALAKHARVSLEVPWRELPESFRELVLFGSDGVEIRLPSLDGGLESRVFEGVVPSLQGLYHATESESGRQRLRRFMGPRVCPACSGQRLRPELLRVLIRGRCGENIRGLGIAEFCGLTIDGAREFLEGSEAALTEQERFITTEVRRELSNRLRFLTEVGLGYLSLDRQSGSLSGGSAADSFGDSDWIWSGGLSLRARRAEYRIASAR